MLRIMRELLLREYFLDNQNRELYFSQLRCYRYFSRYTLQNLLILGELVISHLLILWEIV